MGERGGSDLGRHRHKIEQSGLPPITHCAPLVRFAAIVSPNNRPSRMYPVAQFAS
ncbi:hypothetical protein Pd630_LPD06347 [Rhodococcus opacus PD630]|nr:hypothetical protein Pd630_LPD06347 [Rhodococcus opacus PD630]